MLNRRGLITGLTGLIITAPAIVRASSLMPVKTMLPKYANGLIFQLRAAFDHVTPLTGATASAYIAKDGGPLELHTAPLVELGNGLYEAKLLAGDLGERETFFRFVADKADPTNMIIAHGYH